MVAKKLGRGLDSLIQKSASVGNSTHPTLEVRQIDPKLIAVNRNQPRLRFDDDALEELATSIKNEGLLQPLVVRRHESGGFELIAGERRLRASLKLNLPEIPVLIRDLDPADLLELALIENIQREDLNPIETARAYRELRETNGWTQSDLADRLGKKRSSVANTLRFLDLPESIQESLGGGEISAGHAKILLSLSPELQLQHYDSILQNGMSVRELEQLVRGPKAPDAKEDSETKNEHPDQKNPGDSKRRNNIKVKAPHVTDQENILSSSLGTKVEIREGRGSGKIVIEYYSTDDFDRIRKQIVNGGKSQ